MSKNSRRRFLCADCGVDTGKIGEFYFLKTKLWLTVMSSIYGMLCVGCLESRLRRKLAKEDFTDATINNSKYGSKSQRLCSRLIT